MTTFDEAQQRVLDACAPLGAESVAVGEAMGRVLAATLRASADLVPFARSAMDGYALRAVDAAPGATLLVRGAAYAERAKPRAHEPHTATQVATGAPIPAGADAVVPVEEVVRENGAIRLSAGSVPGTHVFPPGEDARAGDELALTGTRLQAADVALLAAAGHARIPVFRRPRAVIVSTGDEIVDPTHTPAYGQIRNSNAVVLAATLHDLGCEVVSAVHVRDDRTALGRTLASELTRCDLLVTTGGASVGERDLVKPLLRELGCAFAFDSVALRPARPTAFGVCSGTRVAVLPGNPSSAFVALHEFVRLAALGLAGCGQTRLPRVRAMLAGHVHGKVERAYAVYATLRVPETGFVATPLDNQCSALTRTAADADGFIVVPPGRHDYGPGDRVAFDVVDWTRVAAINSQQTPSW
jgi:molybdopterin molybdotransferase